MLPQEVVAGDLFILMGVAVLVSVDVPISLNMTTATTIETDANITNQSFNNYKRSQRFLQVNFNAECRICLLFELI